MTVIFGSLTTMLSALGMAGIGVAQQTNVGRAPPVAALHTIASATTDPSDVIANFFVARTLAAIVHGGCTDSYQAKLQQDDPNGELERALPGVRERMVAATSASCDAQVLLAMQALRAEVVADWADSPLADRRRLAGATIGWVMTLESLDMTFRPDETATQVVARVLNTPKVQASEQALGRSLTQLAASPAGRALVERFGRYQQTADTMMQGPDSPFFAIITQAKREGELAANAFARERKVVEPFP